MLSASGRRVFVGGNLGRRSPKPRGGSYDDLVVEVSSFQLEWAHTLAPAVAAVLNVTPDHLDRHGSMESYIAREDESLRQHGREATMRCFSRDQDWWAERARAVRRTRVDLRARAARSRRDRHGIRDSAAARESGRAEAFASSRSRSVGRSSPTTSRTSRRRPRWRALAGASPRGDRARRSPEFEPLPHRLALGRRDAAASRFFDDSKATNVGATLKSLEAFDEPVILLAGGVGKGAEFAALAAAAPKLKRVVAYGEAATLIESALARARAGRARARARRRVLDGARATARAGRRRAARAGLRELRRVRELRSSRRALRRVGAEAVGRRS